MTNKQLIITGVIAAAAVAAYFYWQKHKATVVSPAPTTQPVVTPPNTATQPTGGTSGGTSGYIDDLSNAWSGLSGLWDKYNNP